ncbi:MAG: hypothetical protein WAX29_03435 [Propionibacterium sp.]|jgi:hypothetical protein|uniref:hypothetical protein n=1 Tax=Bifidobacterium tibiigranuli TaxID=2172043 RepID=UPI002357456B|nr:hypothetical protein [Bifidobacterium tibiigranuli]MCH3973536.1 hypothetical protein [Bifidobacterium tibiigranuli]
MSWFFITLIGLLACQLGLGVVVRGLQGDPLEHDRMLFAVALLALLAGATIVYVLVSMFGWWSR